MLRGRRPSLLIVAALAWPAPANAGCPKVCELSAATAVVVPSLDCLHVTASSDTCDCGVFVDIANDCTVPVAPVGFAFPSCAPIGGGALEQPCPSIPPGSRASIAETASTTGAQAWSRTLSSAGTSYTLTASGDVTSIQGNSGSSCSFASTAMASRGGPWLLVLCALTAGALCRRRSFAKS